MDELVSVAQENNDSMCDPSKSGGHSHVSEKYKHAAFTRELKVSYRTAEDNKHSVIQGEGGVCGLEFHSLINIYMLLIERRRKLRRTTPEKSH